MRLYLLRHGEAEPYRQPDADRVLVRAGRRAVDAKQPWLVPVQSFYCSPYLRARQSADIIKERLGHAGPVLDDRLTPDRSVAEVLDLLQSLETDSCLLVGHNPLLSQLICDLAGEPHSLNLPTAGLACLEADDWYPGGAVLKWIR